MNEYKQLLEKVNKLAEEHKPYEIKQPSDVIDYLIGKSINKKDQEVFKVIYCNSKNKIIKETEIEGTIDRAIIYIRDIIKNALLCNATAIILTHNHPSGSTKPSSQDMKTTTELKKAADIFNIKLLDHIITAYGTSDYFSFVSEKIL
jgi:DNA repair protein RadC